ncbi:MAG: hypothetical protein GY832_20410, partial [Chloroflexi bacterium]|nr:hypothetical protein [Chloroflexota bacterium]
YNSPTYPVEGLQLTYAYIIWPLEGDPNPPIFYLRGRLSLPGVDQTTRPADATVNLNLAVGESQPAELVTGEQTISFQPFYWLWTYVP